MNFDFEGLLKMIQSHQAEIVRDYTPAEFAAMGDLHVSAITSKKPCKVKECPFCLIDLKALLFVNADTQKTGVLQ